MWWRKSPTIAKDEPKEEPDTVLAKSIAEAPDSDNATDVISVAALSIGCVALLFSIVLGGVQYASTVPKQGVETQSLGSKNIE